MPFSETAHGTDDNKVTISEAQWTHIYENWIKKAVESYAPGELICKRSPAKPGNFVKGIIADLDSSSLVIADLTGAKPNVYYELGIRHALRVGTIIITQHFDALPSDLKNYFVFEYNYSEKAHEYVDFYSKFEKKMHETIRAWDETTDPSDSPVSDFLGIINQKIGKELEKEKQELKRIFSKLKGYFSHNFEVCEDISAAMKNGGKIESERMTVVDVFAIDSIYMRLVAYNWKHINHESLDSIEQIIVFYRRIFNEVSVTWNALHANPNQPPLREYLFKLLRSLHEGKARFDNEWDSRVNPAIDSIKLVKRGKGS